MDRTAFFSYALSIAFIAGLLLVFDFSEVFEIILGFDVFLFFLIVLFYSVTYVFRAAAWKIIVEPFARISLNESFDIISVSLLANHVFPMRVGELIRAFLLSETKKISKTVSFSTVLISRISEIVVLVIFFVFSLSSFPTLDKNVVLAVIAFGGAFIALLLVFVFHEKTALVASKILPKKVAFSFLRRFGKNLLSGGKSFGKKKNFIKVFFFTLLTWIFVLATVFTAGEGLSLDLGLPELLLIVSLSSLSTMIPSAPGFIGTFQAAFVAIFLLLGLDVTAGLSMSILLHTASYLSTVILGIFSLNRLGVSLKKILLDAKNRFSQNR